MKRLFVPFFIALCFVGTAVSLYRGYVAYAETAPLRQRIAQLRNSAEVIEAQAAFERANHEMDAYCSSDGIICKHGGSYRIDTVAGKAVDDFSALHPLRHRSAEAKDRRDLLNVPIELLEDKVKERSSPIWGFGISGVFLSAFGAFASWIALKKKKEDEPVVAALAQDEQDRREIEQLHEKIWPDLARIQFLESRLAPTSYREPDRSVEPVVPTRVVIVETPVGPAAAWRSEYEDGHPDWIDLPSKDDSHGDKA